MALTPGFPIGPPPQSVTVSFENGRQVVRPNVAFFIWTTRVYEWLNKFGANADGAASFSGSIAIGTSPNWFKADASGIWLGGATFGASPFRVSMAGALTATSGTFSGSITGATGTFSGDVSTSGSVIAQGNGTFGSFNGAIMGVSTVSGSMGVYGEGTTTNVGVYARNADIAGTALVANANAAGKAINVLSGSTTLQATTATSLSVGGSSVLVSGGALGTPSSGTLTNCTFPTLNQNTTGSAGSLLSAGHTFVQLIGVAGGSATATFSSTTKPGSSTSSAWASTVIDGTTYYIPIWQ